MHAPRRRAAHQFSRSQGTPMSDPPARRRPARAHALLLVALLGGLAFAAQDDDWPIEAPAPEVKLEPERLEGLEGFSCAECHGTLTREWAASAHGVAWLDEVYQETIAERSRPELCHSCHIPEPLLAAGALGRPKARADDLRMGVSCATCHAGPDGVQLGARGVETTAHATASSAALRDANELCAACHSTNVGPVIGVAKDFVQSKQAERGRSCVGCHMATRPAAEDEPDTGERPVRSHALQTPRDPAFLRLAFAPRHVVEDGKSRVVIANRAGHRVPGLTGREITFEARLLAADGTLLGEARLEIDTRRYLPVDGERALEFERAGARVELVGLHEDPRHIGAIRFLEETLAPER